MVSAPFRFDRTRHTYLDLNGGEYPHITGMLVDGGLVDSTWFTEESCVRGQHIHTLTAHHDMGVLQLPIPAAFRDPVMAYARAVSILQPEWEFIEVPCVHPERLFGGRPDRVGRVHGLVSVVEIKSGAPLASHCVQTALQAILVAPTYRLNPEHIARFSIYLQGRRYFVEQHKNPRDFTEAELLIQRFAHAAPRIR